MYFKAANKISSLEYMMDSFKVSVDAAMDALHIPEADRAKYLSLIHIFGTRAAHSGGGYDAYRVKDLDGKEWKIVRDSSIHPECRRRSVLIGENYKVELNSPKLEYGEIDVYRRQCIPLPRKTVTVFCAKGASAA